MIETNPSRIKPVGKRVLVKLIDPPLSQSLIVQDISRIRVVVKVGPKCSKDIKPGDYVEYHCSNILEISWPGKPDHHLVEEDAIFLLHNGVAHVTPEERF